MRKTKDWSLQRGRIGERPRPAILHSQTDDVIPFTDSEELVRNGSLSASASIEVGNDHRLADQQPLRVMLKECGRRP